MNREKLIQKAQAFLKSEYALRKDIYQCLSEILKGTDEDNPKKVFITIDEDKYFGLSSLELPHISMCWLDESAETISFQIEGYGYPSDFDYMTTEQLITILEEIEQ